MRILMKHIKHTKPNSHLISSKLMGYTIQFKDMNHTRIIFPTHGFSQPASTFSQQAGEWGGNVLGALCFSTDAAESREQMSTETPCVHVPLHRLDAGDSVCEIWHGKADVTQGQQGDIHYRCDGEVLFGSITLSEARFEGSGDKTPLQQATEIAYTQVFTLLDTLDYPYLFRFWNYMADINGHSDGLERYQQFTLGRHDAFLTHGRDVVGDIPAACALGTAGGPLTIAFLAGHVEPLSIENPRQISAYQYPQQYGPRSPTFSRASLVRLQQDEVLFISGTASVVGHATLHAGDVAAQTRETMANIEAVLAEANRVDNQPGFDLASLNYRVYVRHPADLEMIHTELARYVGSALKVAYIQADVCRQDLLLEIEATALLPFEIKSGHKN